MSLVEKQTPIPTPINDDYEKKKEHGTSSPSYGSDDDGEEYVIKDKALLRKLDTRLLPALTLLYLLSFLDRSNGALRVSQSMLSDGD